MDFDKFQKEALSTAIYPNRGNNLVYPVLGLVGEAGEVAEKVKKLIRDDDGVLSDERKELLKKELGDVLWYVAATADEMGLTMSEVAEHTIEKLKSRKERGVLKGDGDTR
ncbi:nucleoside triphosphate pyrophosphohydrolase family protein [candidate division WWE3 bacterium]|jgi:NTP pyrophosphatase (non-canonical NTP hydrolase)|nr:nucleoside triphosphate pyrophosphohydrolase family protein [candidate division WWE3 bacterium]MBT7349330.1 nucleoside triphosphate pyrophosphohydrolase family protein [candidate division WWE3 bacterium]